MITKKGKYGFVSFTDFPIKTRADADGVATFDWLPARIQGRVLFWSASGSFYLPDEPFLDAGKPENELTTVVVRSTRVSGKVTRPDGTPSAGILVVAHGYAGRRSLIPFVGPDPNGRGWVIRDGCPPRAVVHDRRGR